MNSRFTKGDIVRQKRPGRGQWRRGVVVKSSFFHDPDEAPHYFEYVNVMWDGTRTASGEFAGALIHESDMTAEIQRGHVGK